MKDTENHSDPIYRLSLCAPNLDRTELARILLDANHDIGTAITAAYRRSLELQTSDEPDVETVDGLALLAKRSGAASGATPRPLTTEALKEPTGSQGYDLMERSDATPPVASIRNISKREDAEANQLEAVRRFLNTANETKIIEETGCDPREVGEVVASRPFQTIEHLQSEAEENVLIGRVVSRYEMIGLNYLRLISLLKTCQTARTTTNEVSAREITRSNSPSSITPGISLKSFQEDGVKWLLRMYDRSYSCILADDMGLGKTAQTIYTIASIHDSLSSGHHHLIIVPASLLENWRREFSKFASGLAVRVYHGPISERIDLCETLLEKPDEWNVLITTYAMAQSFKQECDYKLFQMTKWHVVVFDEAHSLKSRDTKTYKILRTLQAHWKLLLTSTPIQNDLAEVLSLLRFIQASLLEPYNSYLDDLLKTTAKRGAASPRCVGLVAEFVLAFILRRLKKEILQHELPLKTEHIVECPLSERQRQVYRHILEEASEQSWLTTLMNLRRSCAHDTLVRVKYTPNDISQIGDIIYEQDLGKQLVGFKRGEDAEDKLEKMSDFELICKGVRALRRFDRYDSNQMKEGGKISKLLYLLQEFRDSGRRVLIFTQFVFVVDFLSVVLQENGFNTREFTGGVDVPERQGVVDEFNDDASILALILTTHSGGTGLNLVSANVVIFYDLDFNPQNDIQACDRAYRIGQTRDVDVIRLISSETVEGHIFNVGGHKLALERDLLEEVGQRAVLDEQEMSLALQSLCSMG